MRLSAKGTRAVLAALALLGAGCGPDARQRCADLKAAPCPKGQVNAEDGPEFCESRYKGDCSGAWDDYVTCAIKTPECNSTEGTSTPLSPCFGTQFKAYARCECKYETKHGGSSPWCSF